MTRSMLGAVARALRGRHAHAHDDVHFHQSAHGTAMPAVCDDPHCRYPRLDV